MPAQALVAAMGSLVRACALLVVACSPAREGSQAPALGSQRLLELSYYEMEHNLIALIKKIGEENENNAEKK